MRGANRYAWTLNDAPKTDQNREADEANQDRENSETQRMIINNRNIDARNDLLNNFDAENKPKEGRPASARMGISSVISTLSSKSESPGYDF